MGLLDPPALSKSQADTRYSLAAARKRTYLSPRFLPRQVMATPPALSIVSGNSPVTGGSGTGTPNNLLTGGLFTIAGAAGIIPNTIGNTAMYRRSDRAPDTNNRKDGPVKIVFGTDAIMLAINVYWDTATSYRLQVDDQYVSLTPGLPGVAGSTRWLLVDFTSAGGAKPRKIVFETTAAIQGVDIPVTATLWPIPTKGPTVVYFGDSYTGGSNGNDAAYTTWPSIVSDLLGWENTYQNAIGSTGITATVSGWVNNAAGQVAAFTATGVTPDIVVATWGHNDIDTDANLAIALRAAFQTMRTQWPNAVLVYGGPFYTGGPPSAANISRETALLAAVAGLADYTIPQASGAGRPFFAGTGKAGARTVTDAATTSTSTTVTSATAAFTSTDVGCYITGSGIPANAKVSSVTNSTTAVISAAATATASAVSVTITNQKGNGNSDTYVYSDGIHPTQAGHNYLGTRMAQELAARLA